MGKQLTQNKIVDLMFEKQDQLRQIVENIWNEQSDINISHTEWNIMNLIYGKQPTISEVSKSIAITRQATHKNIKSLEVKGLVEITNTENNKRDKSLLLTKMGEQCYEKYVEINYTIESNIAQKIGKENLNALKEVLKLDWGI